MVTHVALVNETNTLSVEQVLSAGRISFPALSGKPVNISGPGYGDKLWWLGGVGDKRFEIQTHLHYNAVIGAKLEWKLKDNVMVSISSVTENEEKHVAVVFGTLMLLAGQDVCIYKSTNGRYADFKKMTVEWAGKGKILNHWRALW